MRSVKYSSRSRRDYRHEKSGRHGKRLDAELLQTVTMLAKDEPPPRRYFDHPLGGEWVDTGPATKTRAFAAELLHYQRTGLLNSMKGCHAFAASMRGEGEAGEAFGGDLRGEEFGFPAQIGLHCIAIAGVAIMVPEQVIDALRVGRVLRARERCDARKGSGDGEPRSTQFCGSRRDQVSPD